MPTPPRPLTPCIQVCQIEPNTATCQGCGRTLDEIACWGSMTEAEKAPIWERLTREGYVDMLRPVTAPHPTSLRDHG